MAFISALLHRRVDPPDFDSHLRRGRGSGQPPAQLPPTGPPPAAQRDSFCHLNSWSAGTDLRAALRRGVAIRCACARCSWGGAAAACVQVRVRVHAAIRYARVLVSDADFSRHPLNRRPSAAAAREARRRRDDDEGRPPPHRQGKPARHAERSRAEEEEEETRKRECTCAGRVLLGLGAGSGSVVHGTLSASTVSPLGCVACLSPASHLPYTLPSSSPDQPHLFHSTLLAVPLRWSTRVAVRPHRC